MLFYDALPVGRCGRGQHPDRDRAHFRGTVFQKTFALNRANLTNGHHALINRMKKLERPTVSGEQLIHNR
jgi:hypothetical protein